LRNLLLEIIFIHLKLRKSIRRKHTLPNYKCRFKPFFEQIYSQSLYKENMEQFLLKNSPDQVELSGGEANEEKKNDAEGSDTLKSNSLTSLNDVLHSKNSNTNLLGDDTGSVHISELEAEKRAKRRNILNNIQYKRLCEKLGCDLTSIGQLNVRLKFCDRLPEALYSLNYQQHNQSQQQSLTNASQSGSLASIQTASQSHQQQQSNSQPQVQNAQQGLAVITHSQSQTQIQSSSQSQASQPQPQQQQQSPILDNLCTIYLTSSVDEISMSQLMSKQICKEHWPLIQFELVKSNQTLNLGIVFVELVLINRTEVCIHKIFEGSLASQHAQNLKPYDIVYSLNQNRIASLKQLNKLIQKTPLGDLLKFAVQRPCVQMEDDAYNMNNLLAMIGVSSKSGSSSLPTVMANGKPASNSGDTGSSSNAQPVVSSSSSLVSRLKLERLKLPFGVSNNTAAALVNSTASTANEATNESAAETAELKPSSSSNQLTVASNTATNGSNSGRTSPSNMLLHQSTVSTPLINLTFSSPDNNSASGLAVSLPMNASVGPGTVSPSTTTSQIQLQPQPPLPSHPQPPQSQTPTTNQTLTYGSASCLVEYFCSISECAVVSLRFS
jgi:hypothetical protein